MRRALAVFIILLNLFVMLIGVMYIAANFLVKQDLNAWMYCGAGPLLLLCPVSSFLFLVQTRNTVRPPAKGLLPKILDDLTPEESKIHSLSNSAKAAGIFTGAGSIWLMVFCCYLLWRFYTNGRMDAQSFKKADMTIIPVVLLFNAICQPLYVWKTFRNVKIKK
ncbi:MAG: hypothetical protein ACHQRM_13530 [Bacteroidia bacterium]